MMSKGTLKVLDILLNKGNFNFNELARKTGLTVAGISKIAKNLKKEGIVNLVTIGRSKVVKLNLVRDNFEILALVEKYRFEEFSKRQPKLSNFLKMLKWRCRDEIVLIFGSYASGEEDSHSDLDLLVISSKPRYDLFKDLMSLVDIDISPIFVTKKDFITEIRKGHQLYKEIYNGKRILINGAYDFWRMMLEVGYGMEI